MCFVDWRKRARFEMLDVICRRSFVKSYQPQNRSFVIRSVSKTTKEFLYNHNECLRVLTHGEVVNEALNILGEIGVSLQTSFYFELMIHLKHKNNHA